MRATCPKRVEIQDNYPGRRSGGCKQRWPSVRLCPTEQRPVRAERRGRSIIIRSSPAQSPDFSCNDPPARQGVYEHARRVLLAKLRSTRPRPSKHVIGLEQFALEQAIKKVEAECRARETKAVRTGPRSAGAPMAVRRPGRPLMRVLAPFGLAIFVAGIVTAYWLAGGRFNNLSFARPRLAAAHAPAAKPADAATSRRRRRPGRTAQCRSGLS